MTNEPYITWANEDDVVHSRLWDEVNEDPEEAPEFATLTVSNVEFTDWSIFELKEFMDVWEFLPDETDQAAYAAYCDDTSAPESPCDFASDYLCTMSSFVEYVQELAADLHDIPAWLEGHVDWDSVADEWSPDYRTLSTPYGVAIFTL